MNRCALGRIGGILLCLCMALPSWADMPSDRVSDITNTKHNFARSLGGVNVEPNLPLGATRNVVVVPDPALVKNVPDPASRTNSNPNFLSYEDQNSRVCVFCHTPHNATEYSGTATAPDAPLWNRSFALDNYSYYQSSSMDAAQPTNTHVKSKVCLSCHDGTLAIGGVAVVMGIKGYTFNMNGTAGGAMPGGQGANTGFTPNLGTDLRNDHPISIVYDALLANKDGELASPVNSTAIGVRGKRLHPSAPLEPGSVAAGVPGGDASVECTTCHDPHLTSSDPLAGNIKFLRLHRFQKTAPLQGVFDAQRDIGCVACHEKQGWVESAHANPLAAEETYTPAAANLHEFKISNDASQALPVWRVSCLNCHDSHTVPGARKLLREAVISSLNPAGAKLGGAAAQEEVCLGCHSSGGAVLQSPNGAPDIRTAINQPYHMPITTADQSSTVEEHGNFAASELAAATGVFANQLQLGKDLVEPQSQLGLNDPTKRHAECTDCHNPHRARKTYSAFTQPGTDDAGHHDLRDGTMPSNIASGSLRGGWGVEPIYQNADFNAPPIPDTQYQVKRGDPGSDTLTGAAQPYVTREYQICLKCHSSFAYGAFPPDLPGTGIPFPNDMTRYTDQAMEFQAPLLHKGEAQLGLDSGAAPAYQANNHRSWHPVMDNTGRSGAAATTFVAPFTFPGEQTMYCSDCHGMKTAAAKNVPDAADPTQSYGPHGSTVPFILKGPWDATTGGTGTQDHLCFKCHRYEDYADPTNTTPNKSGFANAVQNALACGAGVPRSGNLHVTHASCMQSVGATFQCTACHIAVPHGWKNKALLVNLNDLGAEAGAVGAAPADTLAYTKAPYYANAKLRVIETEGFKPSGQWTFASCGGVTGCHQ